MENLPDPNTRRWNARRKVALLDAVRSGHITFEAARHVYQLSEEELRSWERAYERHGLPGLRATRIQMYRSLQVAHNVAAD